MSTLQDVPGLQQQELKAFTNELRETLGCEPGNVRQRGRYLEFTRSPKNKWTPAFSEDDVSSLKHDLLPTWAQSFEVTSTSVYCVLKTSGQLAADYAAFELDESLKQAPGYELARRRAEILTGQQQKEAEEANRKAKTTGKKNKKPTDRMKFVLNVMREVSPAGQIETEELQEQLSIRLPPSKTMRGDRRDEYAKNAIRDTVTAGHLFVHGDEQEYVSLHRVKEVNE